MVELVRQNLKINRARFAKAKRKILDSIDADIIVEHVGSTAIPKMYGKNIVDVLVGVNNRDDFNIAIKGLEKIGFIGSEKSRSDEYMFFAPYLGETHDGDVHVHIVLKNTKRIDDFLLLRDYLLSHPKEAKDYSDFKKNLIKSGVTDRKEYKRIKALYVSDLIQKAIKNEEKKFKKI